MSKLDDIVSLNETVPNEEIKRQFKDLMLGLIGQTRILGPEHPQLVLYQIELRKKVEEL